MSNIDQSLSDLWRENRSKDPGTDLASILDGSRIMAQSLNPEVEVTFTGVEVADTNRRQIYLSPSMLGDKYPVPGDIVDRLLGLTVHEVGHILFSENNKEYIDGLAKKAGYSRYSYGSDYLDFQSLANAFEDIYIDHVMNAYPGYKDYLQKERAWALGKFSPDSVTRPLQAKCTRADILNALIYLNLTDGKMPQNISQENLEILSKVATYANKMCTRETSKDSAVLSAWGILKGLPVILSDEERGFGKTEGEVGTDEKEEAEETQAQEEAGEAEPETNLDLVSRLDTLVDDKTELPDDLAKEVSEAIIEKRYDLSQLLSYLAKDSHCTVIAYTPQEDAERAAKARAKTASTEEKLRRILQDYRLKRTKDYRGLMSGRISARRLHRVAYGDKRVFQRRDKPELVDMAVCLLMDLSGSVSVYRDLIEQITVAICDAFKKERMEFIALGYSGRHNIVSIPRLYDREVGKVNLGLEKEWMMTPSYEGLAAAIAQLLRLAGRKQKILFHFTDGEPNNGGRQAIAELLQWARIRRIIDIHVCLTSSSFTPERFRCLYGEDTLFINEIDQLPDAIDKKLRERLKI